MSQVVTSWTICRMMSAVRHMTINAGSAEALCLGLKAWIRWLDLFVMLGSAGPLVTDMPSITHTECPCVLWCLKSAGMRRSMQAVPPGPFPKRWGSAPEPRCNDWVGCASSQSSLCVCLRASCRHVTVNAGSVEARNYAGTFSNGVGASTFIGILPPVGAQVWHLCHAVLLILDLPQTDSCHDDQIDLAVHRQPCFC